MQEEQNYKTLVTLTFNSVEKPQPVKLNRKKRKKEKYSMATSTGDNSFNNQENKYDAETIQQVKRLKMLSFNAGSPVSSPFKLNRSSYSNMLSLAADLSLKKKTLTNKLIEIDDDFNSNSCSLDSGFGQTQQQQTDELLKDNEYVFDDSNDSDFEDENEISFRINKHKSFKLLDISNCSAQSASSLSSPYQARRCLFKAAQSPLVTANEKPTTKMQITPISISRHNSIITNDSNDELMRLFNDENKESQMNHENIMKMLDIEHSFKKELVTATAFSTETDIETNRRLIGDRSSYHLLPTKTSIKHNDLNVITPETLTRVLNGEFKSEIDKLIIIDSRYPYEFEGGHIRDAKNIYTKENIIEMFLNNEIMNKENENRRVLVIFHCEFSSERGPGLLRFLRSQDRLLNKDSYPKLFYPELYLLEGGYKSFYEQHSDYCEPKLYKPMLHKDHVNDLKHFRAKTKTWESQHKYLSNCCSSANKTSNTSRLIGKKSILNRFQRFPRSTLF